MGVSREYLAESTVPTLHGILWLSVVIPFIFVVLRTYVRLRIKRTFGLDGTVAIIAMVVQMAYCFVFMVAGNKGLGRHVDFVSEYPQDLITVGMLCQIAQTLAIMACTISKTTFAITLLRIVIQKWAIIILWFVIVTMNIFNVLAAAFVFGQCKYPRHLWDAAIPSQCWPTNVFTNFLLFVGGYSGAQDFVLAVLPWLVIMNSQMRLKEKIAVDFAMSLGIFAGTAAIIKTVYLVALSEKANFTWELPMLLCWAAAEIALTIVASSIPTLRPLLALSSSSSSKIESNTYLLKSVGNSTNMFYPQSRQAQINTNVPAYSDKTISEENVYRRGSAELYKDGNRRHSHGIRATTDVTTTYINSGRESSIIIK